ncbi:hypothetical protein KSB_91840 [Ktedonobacter robiniae]|uniref:Uncharacterized protein n=1 Tax=Ktedonobacter robiniae TaxID=2778365 RepID=A0ABQ3V6U6_9CHLR|nr:hypothetical protein KSB_91840 [Ktedonobacter robiniae]
MQQMKDDEGLQRELTLILSHLDAFAARVKDGLQEADWQTRRDIIRALVKRVEVDQEQVRVVFRVNPPPPSPHPPLHNETSILQHCGRRDWTSLRGTFFGSVENLLIDVACLQPLVEDALLHQDVSF